MAAGITHETIEARARRIVERFHPERVILFGSHARVNAGPDSDVDILVVMEVDGSVRARAAEVAGALHDFGVPEDIVVVRPEDFERRGGLIGTIAWPAAREGQVLHARAG